MSPIIVEPSMSEALEKRMARSLRLAPIACPTSVVDAAEMPKPGM